MRHAINLPLFGPLADPAAIVEIGQAADENGWDGLFVWDHILSPLPEAWEISDPWVVLAAVAATTRRIRLGTMVTPLARRRIIKLARETVTLDRLSSGRLTLGLGLGGDAGREFSAFGDPTEARPHAEVLDEGVKVLTALWSGGNCQKCWADTSRWGADRTRTSPAPENPSLVRLQGWGCAPC